jgi:hypothetical protein
VKILEAAGMAEFNSTQMSMEERLKLSQNSEAEEDATLYHKLINSLRYLVHTRSDLIFVVGYLSRFMQRPTTQHMAALKRVLRYIAGSINLGCFYRQEKAEQNWSATVIVTTLVTSTTTTTHLECCSFSATI